MEVDMAGMRTGVLQGVRLMCRQKGRSAGALEQHEARHEPWTGCQGDDRRVPKGAMVHAVVPEKNLSSSRMMVRIMVERVVSGYDP